MKLSPEKLTAFCAALTETCNIGKAAAAVGITRQTAYEWRSEMPDFATRWDAALKIGVTALEDEAHRRAFEGVEDPLVHQGQFTYLFEEERNADGEVVLSELTGQPNMVPKRGSDGQPIKAAVRKYSDTLAIFLLKAHNPDKYRENSKVELSGQLDINKLSDSELDEALAAEMARAQAASGASDAIGPEDESLSDML